MAHQPGTLLFESDTFSLQNKYNTVTIHGLGLELPEGTSEVTWSVEFLNLGVGRAGLLLYDPPTLGKSHDDFWEKVKGEWELKSTPNGSNFAARLAGVPIGKDDDEVIYENAKNSLGKVYLSSKEVGDTVILDGDNSELTAIQFEYYAALSPFGDIPKGKVRIYLNDGESQATAEVPVDPRGEMELRLGGLVVYDNARGAKGEIQFVSDEIGDEFTLDGSQRVINQIQFEYFAALNPFETTQKGELRFYANNGPVTGEGGPKKPGDLLFESDTFSLRAGYNMVTVSDLRVRVPEEVTSVTWAVEFTGVPNMAWVFGYFRASWTLRVDIMGDFISRMLKHMDDIGAKEVRVELREEDKRMDILPWMDTDNFNPGYMMRSLHLMPKRGAHDIWQHSQDYWREKDEMPLIDLDGEEFVYDGIAARAKSKDDALV